MKPPEQPTEFRRPEGAVFQELFERPEPRFIKDVPAPGMTLYRGISLLEKLSLRPFLSMGTALGLHRDGALIETDTDLDVGIMAHYRADSKRLHSIPTALAKVLGMKLVRTMHYFARPMQLAFIDPHQNDALFDIYLYYKGLKPGFVINVNDFGFMAYPEDMFDHVAPRETSIGIMPMLRNVEEYLAWQYGDTWKTPREKDKGIYYAGKASLEEVT